MNIAFPALLIFLFLLPGFLFRTAFRSLEGHRLDAGPFASSSLKSVLYAFVLNLIAWACVETLTPYTVHWDALLALFIGEKAEPPSGVNHALSLIEAHPVVHVSYFVALYLASAAGGWLLRLIVQRCRLDRVDKWTSRLFRSGSEWFYLFSGYDEKIPPTDVYVTSLVDLDVPYLYEGLYKEHFLEDGRLDRIVLRGTRRRKMSADRKGGQEGGDPEFYPIRGDFFVLRYSECITLNVWYVWADMDLEEDEGSATVGIVG